MSARALERANALQSALVEFAALTEAVAKAIARDGSLSDEDAMRAAHDIQATMDCVQGRTAALMVEIVPATMVPVRGVGSPWRTP